MEEVHRQYGSVTRGHHQVADMEAQDINTLGFPLPSGHKPSVDTATLEVRIKKMDQQKNMDTENAHRKIS